MIKKNRYLLCLALFFCIIGAMGQNLTQTNFGKVSIKNLNIQTVSGHTISVLIYIPNNATVDNKAPVIIATHGGNDDKNLMRRYALELARRGYITVNIDMYGHGDSSWLPDSQWLTAGRGVYDIVKYVSSIPYVDTNSISLLGYSRGGRASSEAILLDDQENSVIKNVYILFSDPIYKNSNDQYIDVYGARNIRVLADLYDEFFFTEKEANTGTYSNDANRLMLTLTSPVDYINSASAQSFLYFGEDPKDTNDKRLDSLLYSKVYGDSVGTREIRSINEFHMAGHYSLEVIEDVVNFFDTHLNKKNNIKGILLVTTYDMFSFIGMFGMVMLLIYIPINFVSISDYFRDVKKSQLPEMIILNDKKRIFWNIGAVLLGILFNILVIWWLNKYHFSLWFDSLFRANKFVYIPLLCLLCSIFILGISVFNIYIKTKREGLASVKTQLNTLFIDKNMLFKTIILSVLVVIVFYTIACFAYYSLGTIYKYTMWSFQTFSVERLGFAILMMPMFVLFYVVSAINNDGLGYSTLYGRNRHLNNLITAFMNALPLLVVLVYVYGEFIITGWNPMFGGNAAVGTSLFPVPVIIFVLIFVSRKIFESTGNIYLGAIISGIIASTITANSSEIRIPEVGDTFYVSIPMLSMIVISYAVFVLSILYFKKLAKQINSL